jgi:type IV secretory pathway VirB10-like protein
VRPALFVVISSLLSCATSSPTPAPTTTHAEEPSVAAAFEPEPTAAPPVQVKAPPPLPDVRAPFREASEAAQRALASKDLDGARQEATRATKLAGTLGATERVKAAELTFKVALAAGAAGEAREAARDWLGACGGEGVEVCRTQALNALVSTARLEPAATKELRDEVAELQKAESCFKTSERANKPER